MEQGHQRFKRAVDQALLLRGNRDFADRAAYAPFLELVIARRNAGRTARYQAERATLRGWARRRWRSVRACGNGVVPLVAAHAFRTLAGDMIHDKE